jgi:hypothetical protein
VIREGGDAEAEALRHLNSRQHLVPVGPVLVTDVYPDLHKILPRSADPGLRIHDFGRAGSRRYAMSTSEETGTADMRLLDRHMAAKGAMDYETVVATTAAHVRY